MIFYRMPTKTYLQKTTRHVEVIEIGQYTTLRRGTIGNIVNMFHYPAQPERTLHIL